MFEAHFAFQLPAAVDFVGGGGKTGLILRLLEEYSQSVPTVFTTTTRIHPPETAEGMLVLSGDMPELLLRIIGRLGGKGDTKFHRLVVTSLAAEPNLLRGLNPDFMSRIDGNCFPLILNEADGAHGMSLKMPRAGEPVLMDKTDYLVPVIGLDCLNQPLGPATLFRWELARSQHSFRAGEEITPELAAAILLHPQGVCRGCKPETRVIPYINKVDSAELDSLAGQLALALLHNGRFPVERVVWGSVKRGRAGSVVARVQ